jgi:hypothetical protein
MTSALLCEESFLIEILNKEMKSAIARLSKINYVSIA